MNFKTILMPKVIVANFFAQINVKISIENFSFFKDEPLTGLFSVSVMVVFIQLFLFLLKAIIVLFVLAHLDHKPPIRA